MAGSPLHSQQTTVDGIHTAIAYTYADAAARLAAGGFVADDVGKFARQLNDNSVWMLVGIGPTAWVAGTGVTGSTGPMGDEGPVGEDGPPGPQGVQGVPGVTGSPGAQGAPGAALFFLAADGEDGSETPGPQGVTGATGSTGAQGATGAQGVPGLEGEAGLEGEVGPPGLQGAIGATGAPGAQGPVGAALFFLAADGEDGAETPGPAGAVGLQGTPGSPGAQGAAGPALFFLAADGEDGAETPGPAGAAGSAGAPGAQGVAGPPGLAGEDGVDGDIGVGIPGPQGAQGPQGPAGVGSGASGAHMLVAEHEDAEWALPGLPTHGRHWPWSASHVLSVDPAGTGDFTTIQAAINASPVDSGMIIFIAPGIYPEQLTLKSGVHLVGMTELDDATLVANPPGVWVQIASATSVTLAAFAGTTKDTEISNIGFQLAASGAGGTTFRVIDTTGSTTAVRLVFRNCTLKITYANLTGGASLAMVFQPSGTAQVLLHESDSYALDTPNGNGVWTNNAAWSLGGGGAAGEIHRGEHHSSIFAGTLYTVYVPTGSTLTVISCETIDSINRAGTGNVNFYGGGNIGTAVGDADDGTGAANNFTKGSYGNYFTNGTKQMQKLALRSIAGDVPTPSDGDVWFNATTKQVTAQQGGAKVPLFNPYQGQHLLLDTGIDGDDGAPGPAGVAGAAGSPGSQGLAGAALFLLAADGEDGADGVGQRGAQGPAGAGGGTSGTTTVDFGAFPGKTDAEVVITGQTGIVAGSIVVASVRAVASADHTVGEHVIEQLKVVPYGIVAGTGFSIRVFCQDWVVSPLESGGAGQRDVALLAGRTTGFSAKERGGAGNGRLYGVWNLQWSWS